MTDSTPSPVALPEPLAADSTTAPPAEVKAEEPKFTNRPRIVVQKGTRVRAQNGVVYVVDRVNRNQSLTLRREFPKFRGKAARREDKLFRRLDRAAKARLEAEAVLRAIWESDFAQQPKAEAA